MIGIYLLSNCLTDTHHNLNRVIEFLSLKYLFFHLFSHKKVTKKRRGDKFSGSPLAVGKTDAYAFLLREKFSVS